MYLSTDISPPKKVYVGFGSRVWTQSKLIENLILYILVLKSTNV